jgi:hypothetical protein
VQGTIVILYIYTHDGGTGERKGGGGSRSLADEAAGWLAGWTAPKGKMVYTAGLNAAMSSVDWRLEVAVVLRAC